MAKRKGERYAHLEEANGVLAIEHGYAIVPFAAVGAEEAVDIILDGDNPLLDQAVRRAGQQGRHADHPRYRPDAGAETGDGSTGFGEPISTEVRGQQDDDAVRGVREETKKAVEEGMEFLLAGRRPQSFCAETASRTGAALNSPCTSPYQVATRWASRPSSTTGLPATQAIFARKSHTGR